MQDGSWTPDKGSRGLLVVASLVIVIAGLKGASSLILPFLMSAFLALITLPLMNWLRSKRIPSPLAVLATLIAALSVLAAIVFLIGGSFKGFTAQVPKYQARLEVMFSSMLDAVSSSGLLERLESQGLDLSEYARKLIDPGQALNMVTRTLGSVGSVLSNVFLVLLTIVFILFEAAGFPDKLQAAFGAAGGSERYVKIKSEIQRYLGTKTLVSLATGLIITVALAIIGIDFPMLWGLLAFLLNYIPNLGSIIAAVPPILLASVQFGVGHAVTVAVVFLTVNIVLGNFVEPYFMGRRLGLSTLVVFLSLVFWGWVWGPVGMLLSVPLTMILKIMLENTQDLRWIAVLLGPSQQAQSAPRAARPGQS